MNSDDAVRSMATRRNLYTIIMNLARTPWSHMTVTYMHIRLVKIAAYANISYAIGCYPSNALCVTECEAAQVLRLQWVHGETH